MLYISNMKKHEVLKKEAKAQNYSVVDLAAIIGIHRSTLSSYFSGAHTNIGADMIDKLEKKLGMKLIKKKKD